MKFFIISNIIFILIISTKILAVEYNITPLNVNYHGSIISKSNMIVYGDFGTILVSTNKGKNWEQKSLVSNGDISQIIEYNDTLWALTSSGIILNSTNNGITWKKFQINLSSDDKCYTFCLNDKYIYLRSKMKILLIDRNFQIVKTYTDSILFYPEKDWPNNIISYNAYKFISISNNKIVLSIFADNKDKLLILSDTLSKLDEIILENFINKPYYSLECKNKFQFQDKEVWQLGMKLYYCDLDFKNWNYIFSDTTCGNYFSDNSYLPFTYNIVKDEIYIAYRRPGINVSGIPPSTRQNFDIGIKKYNKATSTFDLEGSYFINDYYTIFPVQNSLDGIYGVTMMNKLMVFEDSILVCYGANKTLLQSTDSGKNWELISYLSGSPTTFLNDSTIYFCNSGYGSNELCISKNKGATFIPIKANYLTNEGYIQTFANILSFNIDSNGNGLIIGCNRRNDKKNIMKTTNGGLSYDFLPINEPYIPADNMTITNLNKIDNQYIFGLNLNNSSKYYNYLYSLDTNLSKIKLIAVDSNKIWNFIIQESSKEFRTIAATNINGEKNIEILGTNDSGKTFTTLLNSNQNLEIFDIFQLSKDSIFIISLTNNSILFYNRSQNTLETIIQLDTLNLTYLQIFSSSSTLYILGDGIFLKNVDGDLKKWKQVNSFDYNDKFYSNLSHKNNFISKFENKLYPSNYYLFELKDPTDVDETEIKYDTHFYAGPSYPLPAKNHVTSKIFWDLSFNLKESLIGVYDSNGNLIADKGDLSLSIIDINTALIEWNCSTQDNGVYFIVFKYNGTYRPIPLIISK